LDPVVRISACCAFAALWLTAAAHKATNPSEFLATLRAYRIVPGALARISAALVVALELMLGIALLAPIGRATSLVATAVLLTIYAAAIGVSHIRGRRHIDCGCMGPGLRQSLNSSLIWRNLGLAAAALFAWQVPVSARPLTWIDAFTVLGAVGTIALLYATLSRLVVNAGILPRTE